MRGRLGERDGRVGARHGRPGLTGRDRQVGLRACSLNGPSLLRARPAEPLAPAAKLQVLPRVRHGDGQAREKGRMEELEGKARVIHAQTLGLAFRPEDGPFRPLAQRGGHRLSNAV